MVGVGRYHDLVVFEQEVSPNEVRGRFAHERVAVKLRAEQVASVDQRAAGGRKLREPVIIAQSPGLVPTVHAGINPTRPGPLVACYRDIYAWHSGPGGLRREV